MPNRGGCRISTYEPGVLHREHSSVRTIGLVRSVLRAVLRMDDSGRRDPQRRVHAAAGGDGVANNCLNSLIQACPYPLCFESRFCS
jgi:hypothetical protein